MVVGVSTDAILAYGYDLGGPEEWKIQGVEQWAADPPFDWYDRDNDDGYGFVDQAQRRLLAAVGYDVDQPYENSDEYRARLSAARAQVGVTIVKHVSGNYPMYIVAAWQMTAGRGYLKELDLVELLTNQRSLDWDEKLVTALRNLDIVPIQPQPCWLLCSYWG